VKEAAKAASFIISERQEYGSRAGRLTERNPLAHGRPGPPDGPGRLTEKHAVGGAPV